MKMHDYLVAASVYVLAFASMGSGAPPEVRPLRLIFITCCKDAAFFQPVKKGMADAARAMDVQCDFAGTEGVDLKAQAEMVRKAVADGYDGIALNLLDAAAFDEVVKEAIQKGVPVVAFNVDDRRKPNARLSGVCQDFVKAGRIVGAETLKFIPPGGKVLLTQHDAGVSALDERLQGIREVLNSKSIPSKVVISGNDASKAVDIIAQELKADSSIKVVLGTGQADTEAAGRAIERDFPKQGYVAAGFDLSPETLRLIKAGVIKFTIDQQPYAQGFYPVVQLAQYCRYGIRPANLDAGATVIRAADVDKVIELSRKQYR
jgi:simple sugar transport system substrate-binding protein